MHEYLKFFGTNNQQEIDHFLIYERDLLWIANNRGVAVQDLTKRCIQDWWLFMLILIESYENH